MNREHTPPTYLLKRRVDLPLDCLLLADSPVILLCKPIEQWLNPLRLLPLTQLSRIRNLEERRCSFNQPLGFHNCRLTHILPSRQNQLMINNPFSRLPEQRRRRMDITWSSLHNRLVPLLWIFACNIPEKSCTQRALNDIVIPTD